MRYPARPMRGGMCMYALALKVSMSMVGWLGGNGVCLVVGVVSLRPGGTSLGSNIR